MGVNPNKRKSSEGQGGSPQIAKKAKQQTTPKKPVANVPKSPQSKKSPVSAKNPHPKKQKQKQQQKSTVPQISAPGKPRANQTKKPNVVGQFKEETPKGKDQVATQVTKPKQQRRRKSKATTAHRMRVLKQRVQEGNAAVISELETKVQRLEMLPEKSKSCIKKLIMLRRILRNVGNEQAPKKPQVQNKQSIQKAKKALQQQQQNLIGKQKQADKKGKQNQSNKKGKQNDKVATQKPQQVSDENESDDEEESDDEVDDTAMDTIEDEDDSNEVDDDDDEDDSDDDDDNDEDDDDDDDDDDDGDENEEEEEEEQVKPAKVPPKMVFKNNQQGKGKGIHVKGNQNGMKGKAGKQTFPKGAKKRPLQKGRKA